MPQLFLIDGATGAGKSTILEYLHSTYTKRIVVGRKLTTRQRRIGDNEWEFEFVENIPNNQLRYSFASLGNHYAINFEELTNALSQGLTYAVTLVDKTILKQLSSDFKTASVYVYRPLTDENLQSLLVSRGSDAKDWQSRKKEVESIGADYLDKIDIYNHIILNVGIPSMMIEQVSKILRVHGIYPDSEVFTS